MNKLLAYFGLMKISTARSVTAELHAHYVKCAQSAVESDFGAKVEPYMVDEAVKWWVASFDKAVESGGDTIQITNKPEFDRQI